MNREPFKSNELKQPPEAVFKNEQEKAEPVARINKYARVYGKDPMFVLLIPVEDLPLGTTELFTTPQECPRCADHVVEIKRLKDEVNRLSAIKYKHFNNDECWLYQEDGDNHLDTLVCPVVIQPKKLAALEAEITRLREEAQAVNTTLFSVIDERDKAQATIEHCHDVIARLTKERDEYKVGWEKASEGYRSLRDSIGKIMEAEK